MIKNNSQTLIILLYLFFPSVGLTAEGEALNTQTLLLVFSTALVFFMQAGFACLESGFVRSKNAINVIMKNYSDMSFGLMVYWIMGFAFMFGSNPSGWIGLSGFFFENTSEHSYIFFLYHAMFAATAATIISGAVAERMRYGSYLLIATLVTGIIYPIAGSWIWNDTGWLANLGFIDFAGSTAVHSLGAWAALAAIMILGSRTGRFSRKGEARDIPGHNLTLVALGAFILWFGWFGFNSGNVVDGQHDIGQVLINTFLSASASVMGALGLMALFKQPILMTRTINSGLAGLVAVTAGVATMQPMFAVLTGLVASAVMLAGEQLLLRFRLDDVVGAISVHGFAGAWGTLAAGLFFTGDLFNLARIEVQLIGIGAVFIWGFGFSWLCLKVVDKLIGLRPKLIHEQRGLDYSEHYEHAYSDLQQELFHGKQT